MSSRVEVSREALEGLIDSGEIDTVLMVFPDLQGRLDALHRARDGLEEAWLSVAEALEG